MIDPNKSMLKLGLDVHLEFIMAVAQKDHPNPHAPRKFTNDELVAQAAGIRCLANRGHGQVAEYCHQQLPSVWWGPRL